MLSLVHTDIQKQFGINTPMKAAWTWKSGRMWEFHGPEGFYWAGRADNAYHARTQGWASFASSKGVEFH